MFTKQEKLQIIDDTYDYYITQDKPLGYNSEKRCCVYHGPNDIHCAIGRMDKNGLLKDFFRSIYNFYITNYDTINQIFNRHIEVSDIEFLSRLQNIHDSHLNSKDSLAAELIYFKKIIQNET